MPKTTALTREEFEIIIKNYKAAGRDVTELERILAEVYPPKPPSKIPVIGVMPGEEAVIEYSEEIVNCDRNHTLAELRAKVKEAGLSISGDKKTLCKELISVGLL